MYFDRNDSGAVTRLLGCLSVCMGLAHAGCADVPLDTDTGLDALAEAPGPTSPSGELDDDFILSSLAKFRSSSNFVRVNRNPYPSALDPAKLVNLYVSAEGYGAFAGIAPEADGTGLEVPEGTLIVREIQQPLGVVTSLTLMYKGPPGYNPDLNDFWFGLTDPFRTPVEEGGLRMVGKLQECYGCHLARSNDGHLFGVPADNRASY